MRGRCLDIHREVLFMCVAAFMEHLAGLGVSTLPDIVHCDEGRKIHSIHKGNVVWQNQDEVSDVI